ASMHHLVNLALHMANSVGLLLALERMTGSFWRSAFVAALFALHPMHVESVAWVAERKDVLSGLFFMLTLWGYARYVKGAQQLQSAKESVVSSQWSVVSGGRSGTWYGITLALFALGLMSKPMLVTTPFVLLLLDYWPLRRFQLSTLNFRLS